jgi:hypothetical protein
MVNRKPARNNGGWQSPVTLTLRLDKSEYSTIGWPLMRAASGSAN